MKTAALVGVLLIVLGVISFAYQGITYTTHKKVVDIGPLQATTKQNKTIPLPPILGGLANTEATSLHPNRPLIFFAPLFLFARSTTRLTIPMRCGALADFRLRTQRTENSFQAFVKPCLENRKET